MAETQMRSVAPLEPPVCPACQVVMIWYRSVRVGSNLAARYFYCPKCNGIGRLEQRIESATPNGLPDHVLPAVNGGSDDNEQ